MEQIRRHIRFFLVSGGVFILIGLSGCSLPSLSDFSLFGSRSDELAPSAARSLEGNGGDGEYAAGDLKGGVLAFADMPSIRFPGISRVRNSEVERELKILQDPSEVNGLRITMKRAYPMIFELGEILNRHGVSTDLLMIPFIESHFRVKARGPYGSVGIWQFSKSTGRLYGLRIGLLRDERKDPARATHAAALHLRDLYREFHEWPLALAAYNAGLPRIRKACKGYEICDYWRLARDGKIPRVTRRYVPRMIATLIELEELGLWPFAGDYDGQK